MVGNGGLTSVLDEDYEILGELGRGAMGIVLRARHRHLDRLVAIKELPASFAADREVRKRFLDEAQTVARLDHPHVVVVHDFIDRDGHLALVMEQLPGGTLWDRFLDQGVTPAKAIGVILSTAAGVHHANERGVLHRDIKPENLMFADDGQIKVTDFGIAQMLTGDETMATSDGEVLGTPAYMAPEQAEGGQLGPQADVYACGIMLYELLTGVLPQDGNSVVELLDNRIRNEAPPIADRAPHLPTKVAQVVDRSLLRSPSDRWQSAEAMAVALGAAAADSWGPAWLEEIGISVRGAESIERAARTTSNQPATATTPPVDTATEANSDLRATTISGDGATAATSAEEETRATVIGNEPVAKKRPARETTVVGAEESTPTAKSTAPANETTKIVPADEAQEAKDEPGRAKRTQAMAGLATQAPVIAAQPVRAPVVDLRTVAPAELVRIRDVRTTPNPLPLLAASIVAAVVAAALILVGIGGWPTSTGNAEIGAAHETIDGVQAVDFTADIQVPNVPPNAELTLTNRLFGIIPLGSNQAQASAGGEVRFLNDGGLLRFTSGGPIVSDLSVGDDEPFASLAVQPSNSAWFATVPAVASVLVLLWAVSLLGSNLRPLRRGTVRAGAYFGLALSGAFTAASAGLLAMVARVTDAGSIQTLVAAAVAGAIAGICLGEWRRRTGLRRRLKRLKKAVARG